MTVSFFPAWTWVDEKSNRVYAAYGGDLLRFPLKH
jgi:hypothetical protein